MPKVILYIALTIDGFIAAKDGSVSFLDKYSSGDEDFGYHDFLDSIDVVVMGKNTYDQVLSFGDYPYTGKDSFVFTNQVGGDGNASFVSTSPIQFIESLPADARVWLVGGANLASQFLDENLVDELMLFVMPEFLGEGISLFSGSKAPSTWSLLESKSYGSGVVKLHYAQKNNF